MHIYTKNLAGRKRGERWVSAMQYVMEVNPTDLQKIAVEVSKIPNAFRIWMMDRRDGTGVVGYYLPCGPFDNAFALDPKERVTVKRVDQPIKFLKMKVNS